MFWSLQIQTLRDPPGFAPRPATTFPTAPAQPATRRTCACAAPSPADFVHNSRYRTHYWCPLVLIRGFTRIITIRLALTRAPLTPALSPDGGEGGSSASP